MAAFRAKDGRSKKRGGTRSCARGRSLLRCQIGGVTKSQLHCQGEGADRGVLPDERLACRDSFHQRGPLMTIGSGIFWSTVLVLLAVAARQITLHQKWKITGKVFGGVIVVCAAIVGGFYSWHYIKSLPRAPSEVTELEGVKLGMTATEVTLLLGEPDQKTEPTTDNKETKFAYKYSSPDVNITFYGPDKYHTKVSIVCTKEPTTKLLGFDNYSTEDRIIARLGEPSWVSIKRDGLAKIDSYSKWKAAFVLAKNAIIEKCATSSGGVTFAEELLSPEAQKAADMKAAAEAEAQVRANIAAAAQPNDWSPVPPRKTSRRSFRSSSANSLAQGDSSNDPCAPSLSKAERLSRLALFGSVRQTGAETYEAGSHEIFYVGATLISCR